MLTSQRSLRSVQTCLVWLEVVVVVVVQAVDVEVLVVVVVAPAVTHQLMADVEGLTDPPVAMALLEEAGMFKIPLRRVSNHSQTTDTVEEDSEAVVEGADTTHIDITTLLQLDTRQGLHGSTAVDPTGTIILQRTRHRAGRLCKG